MSRKSKKHPRTTTLIPPATHSSFLTSSRRLPATHSFLLTPSSQLIPARYSLLATRYSPPAARHFFP
ncbi:MAG: hypothetical protein LBC18_13935 [Opitutaceae bacterium]|nr:hypothetical protein [Opitutaceae bacterium]